MSTSEVQIREESFATLAAHTRVPIAFTVDRVLDVVPVDGRNTLVERTLDRSSAKDYDALEDPTSWPALFDLSSWGLLAASVRDEHVGGAVIAFDTPGVEMLEGRDDLGVLWDIRVHPSHRRRGVGSALFRAAEEWALARGCRELKVETQNNNVAACRFYARQGCVLRAVNPGAYASLPDEVQLLFSKELG